MTIKAIQGVTVPNNGEIAVTAVTETTEFTGTVTWAPALVNGKFAPLTEYTATITLAEKSGYTFSDVEANFFTVAGASEVMSAVNTGVVTAKFPATLGVPTAAVTDFIIEGVTPPVSGEMAVASITASEQYTGTVSWAPVPGGGVFAPSTAYTATITLTAKTGYTFDRDSVMANCFSVSGASEVLNAAKDNVVTAKFPATAASVVSIKAIPGIEIPNNGEAADVIIDETEQYTGAVTWSPALVDGKFGPLTEYTATITLAAKEGYTFNGVAANFFTVAGATGVSNAVNTGIVTATFPATLNVATQVVSIFDIAGVAVPVLGETPVVTVTETAQYTGTVAWSPALKNGEFAPGTEYTATITLTAKPGYTFNRDSVTANCFTVAGAAGVSNAAKGNVITAKFPVTASLPVSIFNIEVAGVLAPAAGALPLAAIIETEQYSGMITWAPEPVNGKFAPATAYTATITLEPKTGYAFDGVAANSFTVAEHAALNDAGSNVLTISFSPTESLSVTIGNIQGVSAPVTGGVPVASITPTDEYTGTVIWEPAPGGTFAPLETYTAVITLTPKTGYNFGGVSVNFFTVSGAAATNSANSGEVRAVFPATAGTGDDLSQGIALLNAKRYDEAIAKFDAAYNANPANKGAVIYSTLGRLASIAVSPQLKELLENRVGLPEYPGTIDGLVGVDAAWLTTYSNHEMRYEIRDPLGTAWEYAAWYSADDYWFWADTMPPGTVPLDGYYGYDSLDTYILYKGGPEELVGGQVNYYDAEGRYWYWRSSDPGPGYTGYTVPGYYWTEYYRHYLVSAQPVYDTQESRLPELARPEWIVDTDLYNNTLSVGSMSTETFGLLLLANLVEKDTSGLNSLFDGILSSVFGATFDQAVERAEALGDADTTRLSAATLSALGLSGIFEGDQINIGRAELKILFAAMRFIKAGLQWVSAYDWDTNINFLKNGSLYNEATWSDKDNPDLSGKGPASTDLPLRNNFLKQRAGGFGGMALSKASFEKAIDEGLWAYDNILGGSRPDFPAAARDELNKYRWARDGFAQLKSAINLGGSFYYKEYAPGVESYDNSLSGAQFGVNLGAFFSPGKFELGKLIENTGGTNARPRFYRQGPGMTNWVEFSDISEVQEQERVAFALNTGLIEDLVIYGLKGEGGGPLPDISYMGIPVPSAQILLEWYK